MCNAIAHHLLTDVQPNLEQWSAAPGHILSTLFWVWNIPLDSLVSCPDCAPPRFLCICSLAKHEALKGPWLWVNTQQLNTLVVLLSTLFSYWIQNSTVPATKETINYRSWNQDGVPLYSGVAYLFSFVITLVTAVPFIPSDFYPFAGILVFPLMSYPSFGTFLIFLSSRGNESRWKGNK